MIKYSHYVFLALIATTAACGPILPKGPDAPRLFALKADIPAAEKTLPVSLQIQEPTAAAGLDGDRIALKKSPHELDYYAGAKWADTLPAVLRDAVVDAFQRAHLAITVGPDTLSFSASHRLAIDIADFQAEYKDGAANPVLHVRLVARLIEGAGNTVIATDSIEKSVPANGNTLQDVVTAANLAFDQAIGELSAHIQQRIK